MLFTALLKIKSGEGVILEHLVDAQAGKEEHLQVAEPPTEMEDKIAGWSNADDSYTPEANDRATRAKSVAKLRLLWDRRRLLLGITASGLIASIIIAFSIPDRYQSVTRLVPPDYQSESGMAMLAALTGKAGGLGMYASDLLNLKSTGMLFLGILQSRTVQDRLIEQSDLKRIYRARRVEDAREHLESNTKISVDRKTGIITIAVTDKSPQRAAAMAQAYVNELDRLVSELNTTYAHRERVFLEERLKAIKQDLETTEKEFSQIASRSGINAEERTKIGVESPANLQGRLMAAQTELEGVNQVYPDDHVRVRALKARVAELQRRLEKVGGKETATQGGASQKLPLLSVAHANLSRQLRIQEVVYEVLSQQYELAKVQEARETPRVRVLDLANVPERKAFPPRLLIIFLGTLLSLTFGVTWVLGSQRWAEIDPKHPGKVLAQEVFDTLKRHKNG